ncbi:MAG: hypothetical protein U1E56_13220 [Bauldia sp.]
MTGLSRLLLVALALAASVAPALAQNADKGMAVWKDRGGCYNCHGDFGEGGEGGHFPAGPNLRRTQLDEAGLREAIACGRPGTQMPYNLATSYKTTPCFGLPVGAPPGEVTPGASLGPAELDDLIAYLTERVVKKGQITKAECIRYYGDPNNPTCAAYR